MQVARRERKSAATGSIGRADVASLADSGLVAGLEDEGRGLFDAMPMAAALIGDTAQGPV